MISGETEITTPIQRAVIYTLVSNMGETVIGTTHYNHATILSFAVAGAAGRMIDEIEKSMGLNLGSDVKRSVFDFINGRAPDDKGLANLKTFDALLEGHGSTIIGVLRSILRMGNMRDHDEVGKDATAATVEVMRELQRDERSSNPDDLALRFDKACQSWLSKHGGVFTFPFFNQVYKGKFDFAHTAQAREAAATVVATPVHAVEASL